MEEQHRRRGLAFSSQLVATRGTTFAKASGYQPGLLDEECDSHHVVSVRCRFRSQQESFYALYFHLFHLCFFKCLHVHAIYDSGSSSQHNVSISFFQNG
ncbi:unnamed protein product [Amoebophrya sp. A120]|nr:unnamed protein product [Amoebophrya sp. A120]|eukprot:GSA120T00026405001.1